MIPPRRCTGDCTWWCHLDRSTLHSLPHCVARKTNCGSGVYGLSKTNAASFQGPIRLGHAESACFSSCILVHNTNQTQSTDHCLHNTNQTQSNDHCLPTTLHRRRPALAAQGAVGGEGGRRGTVGDGTCGAAGRLIPRPMLLTMALILPVGIAATASRTAAHVSVAGAAFVWRSTFFFCAVRRCVYPKRPSPPSPPPLKARGPQMSTKRRLKARDWAAVARVNDAPDHRLHVAVRAVVQVGGESERGER